MENSNLHEEWVDARLASLDPPAGWQPDAARGLARFRARKKAHHARRVRWTWATVAASLTIGAVFLLGPAPCSGAGCAKPDAAGSPARGTAVVGPVTRSAAGQAAGPAAGSAAGSAPAPLAAAVPAGAPARDFQVSGSAIAPITCEFFSDYECPRCATVFLETMPRFAARYVRTGKVRLVHRDYPLPQHPYARLAARYANAAGQLGHYDAVVTQLFRTQNVWAASGDIGTQVARVLPPAVMEKVRGMVRDEAWDDGSAAGADLARRDHLNQTPSMVVTYKGKRQVLAPIPSYDLLTSYFDELLAR